MLLALSRSYNSNGPSVSGFTLTANHKGSVMGNGPELLVSHRQRTTKSSYSGPSITGLALTEDHKKSSYRVSSITGLALTEDHKSTTTVVPAILVSSW